MRAGERIVLDWFELEASAEGYRCWAADDLAPVAEIRSLPAQCRVCMLRSGFEFRCAGLDEAEQKISACHRLGL